MSLQTVAAHPDAQKGGTAKKKFGDNCVSSQTVAAHPDAQKGGTANKKFWGQLRVLTGCLQLVVTRGSTNGLAGQLPRGIRVSTSHNSNRNEEP